MSEDNSVDRKFQDDSFYDTTPHFKRIMIYGSDIIAKNKAAGENTSPDDFTDFDSLHYAGYGAFKPWFESLPNRPKRVLDLGAGNGSTSRMLAHKYGCEVTSVEYLPYNCRVMKTLNEGCHEELTKNGGSITVHEGDFLKFEAADDEKFDMITSFQVIYHFDSESRARVYEKIHGLLKEGGYLYIEDFCSDKPFDANNLSWSREIIKAGNEGHLEPAEKYKEMIVGKGFEVNTLNSLTKVYSKYVFDRLQKWYNDKPRCLKFLSAAEFEKGAAILASTLNMFHDIDQSTLVNYPEVTANYDLSFLQTEQQIGGYQFAAVKKA